jgi:hypothetical protein
MMFGLILVLGLMQTTLVPFTTVAEGTQSAVEERREVVIRTTAEWERLWREHDPSGSTVPPVDFPREMVAAVFLGTRPTGGYRVEVTALRRAGAALIVEYAERRPDADALLSQALTMPYQIVKFAAHDGPVTFRIDASSAIR